MGARFESSAQGLPSKGRCRVCRGIPCIQCRLCTFELCCSPDCHSKAATRERLPVDSEELVWDELSKPGPP